MRMLSGTAIVLSSITNSPNLKIEQVPVAHIYNFSRSGGRDQEDHGLKPDWAKCSGDPISKSPSPKKGRGLWSGSRCRP
jgi:hypothetical protein